MALASSKDLATALAKAGVDLAAVVGKSGSVPRVPALEIEAVVLRAIADESLTRTSDLSDAAHESGAKLIASRVEISDDICLGAYCLSEHEGLLPIDPGDCAMTLSMYQASVPVFLRGLSNLCAILDKAAAQIDERQIDPAVLLNDRLAPDMFPFVRQVQIASDHAKGATARLGGLEVPKYDDVERSFDELQQRLMRVQDFVQGVDRARIDGSEERDITFPTGGQAITLKGQAYLLHFALPNFYFHVTTAYAILRHNGISIGKRDFIGRLS